jgi:shikimate kinase
MLSNKTIYILIGQKGSGKTLAGQMIQDLFGIKFVRVEDIAKRVKRDREVDDESYHRDAFTEIELNLRRVLEDEPSIVFESTGAGIHFEQMLKNLKSDYKVITICIKADPDLCLKRIKSRDQSIHIDVSDKDVKYINSLVRQRNFECDFDIDNNGGRGELISLLYDIFNKGYSRH